MDEREQKLAFAQRYFVRKDDALIIAANILGPLAVENPMNAINAANTWPFDPIVVEELARLATVSKPKGEYEALALKHVDTCMSRGEEAAAAKFFELALKVAGHLKDGAADKSHGAGHVEDLIDSIINSEKPDEEESQPEILPTPEPKPW
jgi:hypothetical protein